MQCVLPVLLPHRQPVSRHLHGSRLPGKSAGHRQPLICWAAVVVMPYFKRLPNKYSGGLHNTQSALGVARRFCTHTLPRDASRCHVGLGMSHHIVVRPRANPWCIVMGSRHYHGIYEDMRECTRTVTGNKYVFQNMQPFTNYKTIRTYIISRLIVFHGLQHHK